MTIRMADLAEAFDLAQQWHRLKKLRDQAETEERRAYYAGLLAEVEKKLEALGVSVVDDGSEG